MKDEKLQIATDEFVCNRINDLHTRSDLDDVRSKFDRCIAELEQSLTPEQHRLFNAMENAYTVLSGEAANFYYRSGFRDAIELLLTRLDE